MSPSTEMSLIRAKGLARVLSAFCCVALLLFTSRVRSQPATGVHHPPDIAGEHRCGADGFSSQDPSLRGSFIPQPAFPTGLVVQCGSFNLYFEDVANANGQGFDAGGGLGTTRVNTACEVFTYLSDLLVMPPTPVDVYLFSGVIGGGLLAQAGPRVDPAVIASGGITGGEAYQHITTGTDPSPTTYDGTVQVDFTSWAWLSDPAQPFPGCGFDLYSVLLHEATHVLGWISYMRQDLTLLPVSLFTMPPWSQGAVFSEYDARFLWWGDVFSGGVGGPYQKIFDPILMTTIAQPNCLADDRVWMYGTGAGHLDQPINAVGTTLSHFRINPGSFTARAFMAPGFVPNYVMDPGLTNMGQLKRTYTLQELRALEVLGYQFDPAFLAATSINGIDQNDLLINLNTPPYSDDIVGYLPGTTTPSWADYEMTIHGTINNCDDFSIDLSTRPELHDDNGDPIRVFPNSLYGIRGCGNGGNNHLQLSLTSSPGGDVVTFTPRPNFYGRAQFGFHLWDGHEMGEYVVYTIEVLRDGCFQCPASNLVLNGDYEEGTEVALLSDESVVNSVIRDGKEGRLARGLHFSDGHPRNDQGTVIWVGFFGGGTLINDCVRDCPAPTPMNDGFGLHSVEVDGPPGPIDHPAALTGERYNVLGFWNNGSLLCSDLQGCHRYRLSFNVNFDESNEVPLSNYPLLIGFADDVQDLYSHPYPYNYFFTSNILVPNAGTGWHQYMIEFDYCGIPSSLLNIEAPFNFSDANQVYMDDVVLVEVPVAPIQVDAGSDAIITPSCAVNSCAQLQASVIPGNGCSALSYAWSPTTGLNNPSIAAPLACPVSTTTYTVTVSDACGNVGTDEVIVTVVPAGCLTITKNVVPSPTYAWTPVLYTVEVCNNGSSPEDVDLTESFPTAFVPTIWNPAWPTTQVAVPPGGCLTYEITGYYTAAGTHTNMVTLDPVAPGPTLTAEADVTILQNCPMIVSGLGGCSPGENVDLCLGMHTVIPGVTSVSYYLVYPDYLIPPAPGPIAAPVITSALPITSATIGVPVSMPWPPGYSAVQVTVTFPNITIAPPDYEFFCIDFTIGPGGVPLGTNTAWTWASTTAPGLGGWNTTNVVTNGTPTNLWTQAYMIYFDCPGMLLPEASFTVDQILCTGEVTVTGILADPNAVHSWTWGDDRTTPINGAQTYTYNYFEEISMNTGWPVNPPIPAAPPGTYTITHTVILNGVASTSSQQVTVAPCCQANTVIPDGSLASGIGTVFSGTVDVQGQFFVDDDVHFQNCQVYMEPGAEIIVQNGWTLDVDNASFTACNGVMWKSITAQNGSTVRIRGSYMDDAESLVSALDGAVIWVDNTQFHNNRVGVGIPDVGGTYNNVACWVSNSTFYSAGSMPQPYQGQTTAVGNRGFAAVDVHNTTLDFTGGNNIIHTLSNGIVGHGSDMSVADCQMLNIQPDAAYAYTGNGAGIHANGLMSWNYLKQQGYGMTGMPSFNGCRWGVYTEYMNVRSTDNRMLDMGTAYRVDRSGYREVDILYNKVFTHLHGMELRSNDGAAHVLVQNNDITFGDAECDMCRGYTAILVTEGNYVAPDSRILNNTIRFMNAPNSRFGIALTSADDWVVAENTVLMASNTFNFSGIQMAGCRRSEVSCNSITGAGGTYPLDAQSAIRNLMGREPLISCNEMDLTANGILFNGVAYNTDVRGNQFHNHNWPLHLDATAIIDAQTLKGNLWDPGATAPLLGAWYEVSNAQSLTSLFLYDPASIGGGTTVPPSWSPYDWFDLTSGPNYDCADHHGADYCSQFGEDRCKDCLRELDEKIANDSLENDPYTDETKWMLAADLYKKLDDSPALLDSLPELESFYTELQGSTTAAFKAIADDQIALYDLDSTVVAQLQNNRTQTEGLMVLIKDAMEGLGDETLTSTQRQSLLASISGYRQTINSLATWNASALQLASGTKVLSAEGVRSNNATVTTSELIEANEKAVNEVYLATVGKDVDELTAAQAMGLFDIANQCPMVGGNAVFKARSLYWLIDDSYNFDDQLLCLQHGIIVKSLTVKPANAVSVLPNPASDEATLVLDHELQEPGTFVVFDAVGAEVMRLVVPIEMPRIAFSTSSLAPAMYHYQVRGPSGVIGVGKLTIVR